jgi:membrane-bound serine protease (ClpP class)
VSPARRPRHNSPGRLVAALLLISGAGVLLAAAGPAAAATRGQGPTATDAGFVDVVEVSGLLDPVLVDFIEGSIEQAQRDGAIALVLQLNSSGAVVSDDQLTDLARSIADSDVPIAVWVGTSGARATGAAAELVGVAPVSGMAPGTRIGDLGRQRLPEDEFGVLFGDNHDRLVDGTVGSEEALDLGVVTSFDTAAPTDARGAEVIPGAPTVGDFIVNLEGVQTREVTQGGQVRREPLTVVRFGRLGLVGQFAHTMASPNVAYILLVVGLGLLVFELFTAGVGIAGALGAGCLVGSCYGLWILPARWWAVAVIALAFFGFAVDVQTGVPRVWTAIGMVCLVVGSIFLYDGLSLSWVTLVAAWAGALLTFLAGMPAMVRTRFATPTIGRDWMIGEMGEAVADVDPNGTVRVREALWRASTNRATPIRAGEPVRVVAIEGLTLEVEPPEGGARDYRR